MLWRRIVVMFFKRKQNRRSNALSELTKRIKLSHKTYTNPDKIGKIKQAKKIRQRKIYNEGKRMIMI